MAAPRGGRVRNYVRKLRPCPAPIPTPAAPPPRPPPRAALSAFLTGPQGDLAVALILVFMIKNNVQNLFMHLFTT